ncbi:putative geopeptide radical SAM maturase, partial [bacterium]|nr:putative geopeptide radical SAM maturase [bacterium]
PPGCAGCRDYPLCFGGCRYMKLAEAGGVDGVSCQREYLDATVESMVRRGLELRPAA